VVAVLEGLDHQPQMLEHLDQTLFSLRLLLLVVEVVQEHQRQRSLVDRGAVAQRLVFLAQFQGPLEIHLLLVLLKAIMVVAHHSPPQIMELVVGVVQVL
jgi:hypothetical protein